MSCCSRVLLMFTGFLMGCSDDDPRLQGAWKSNREETVAAIFREDPRWAKATPERRKQFGGIFGNMTVTYSNQVATMGTPALTIGTTALPASTNTMHYKVVEKGENHVVIQPVAEPGDTMASEGRRRIQFVDGGSGYWLDLGDLMPGQKEKFDRVLP